MPSDIGRRGVAVELDGAAGGNDPLVQFWQHAARLDMAFVGKEQALAKTSFERRFEFGEAFGVEPTVAGGEPGKTLEIVAVAGVGHHQRAVERRIRQFPAPQVERPQAQPADQRLGHLALAIGCQHAAGPVAGGEHHRGVTALM